MNKLLMRFLAKIFNKKIRVFGNSKCVRLDEFQAFGDKIKERIIYELAEKIFEEGFIKFEYNRNRESMVIKTKIIIFK